MDKVMTVGHEDCEFESSHRRLTRPLGSCLLVAAPFLENGVHCYFNNKGSKR